MKETILVTGACGYIGSILVPLLLENEYKVIAADNMMFKQSSLNHVCYHPNFDFHNVDVRDNEKICSLYNKADIIIPLAAYVGAPLCKQDPVGAESVNKDAVKLLLKKVSREQLILMPTTNSAYGTGNNENYCDEKSPLNPISKYAIDKVEVENALMERQNSVSFRLATVFGMSPRMRLDLLVNDFTYRAVNDGFIVLFESHFKRNYIHVSDVARVFLHAIEKPSELVGQIFNVGLSSANVSKFELCQKIKSQIPSFYFAEAEVGKDPDQRNYIVSNKKIENTGYKPKVELEAGISELIKGFKMLNNRRYGNI